jgi:hypothetical protein
MLGSDPIHQYDSGLDVNRTTGGLGVQGVFTLEPVYKTEAGGGIPAWVEWYLSQNYNGNCLTFGYAQAGQENSFGWPSMKDGLEYQFKRISDLVTEGSLEAETLGETGRWFKRSFELTPASTITAFDDWKDEERRSVWFNCRNYRLNLYAEKGRFWIRDIYLFRENYRERYLDDICTTNDMLYDNLPFVDGNRFSGNGLRSGLYPVQDETTPAEGMSYTDMLYEEEDGKAVVTFKGTPCGDVTFTLTERGFSVSKTNDTPLMLAYIYDDLGIEIPVINQVSEQELMLRHGDYMYNVKVICGRLVSGKFIYPEDDKLVIDLCD